MSDSIPPAKFYRYKAVQYASVGIDGDFCTSKIPNPKLELEEYNLHAETAKGYWIGYGSPGKLTSTSKWVSKTSRKRFAYPTKEEAMENYRARFKRRIQILQKQLLFCKIAAGLSD